MIDALVWWMKRLHSPACTSDSATTSRTRAVMSKMPRPAVDTVTLRA
jgi:hypothetical protein